MALEHLAPLARRSAFAVAALARVYAARGATNDVRARRTVVSFRSGHWTDVTQGRGREDGRDARFEPHRSGRRAATAGRSRAGAPRGAPSGPCTRGARRIA